MEFETTRNPGLGNLGSRWTRGAVIAITALTLAACAGTRTRESTGEFLDDRAMTAKVKTAMLADKEVSGLAIDVDTFKGTVQLSGFAKSEQERQKAGQLARQTAGVKEVKNDIRVR